MAFAKFNVCNPCCDTCYVDYNAYICQRGLGYDPLYSSIWPDYTNINTSGMKAYVAPCTGYDFGKSLCYGVGDPVSEIFYIFEDPSTSGKHRFNYVQTNQPLGYVVVTEDENGFIYRNLQGIPACTGDGTTINSLLVATEWVGGYQCWWKKDYQNYPISIEYDASVVQGLIRDTAGTHYLCSTSGPDPCHPEVSGFGCNIWYISYVPYAPDTFIFKVNDYFRNSLWLSDIQLRYTEMDVYPNGCFDIIHGFQDRVDFAYDYFYVGNPGFSCLITFATIEDMAPLQIYADGVISGFPSPTGYKSWQSGPGQGYFCGTTAQSDATDFLNSLPKSISFSELYIGNTADIGITHFESFDSSSLSSHGIDSYFCPGMIKMKNLWVNDPSNFCFPYSGYQYLTITQ